MVSPGQQIDQQQRHGGNGTGRLNVHLLPDAEHEAGDALDVLHVRQAGLHVTENCPQ